MDSNSQSVLPGTLLLSEPFLTDTSFVRSVVLVTEHNDLGSLGFIINKPTGHTLGEVIENFPLSDAPLHFGGPVETDSLFYLHNCPNLIGSRMVAPGLYFGGDFEELKSGLLSGEISPRMIRFFAGYAGWDAGQLANELKSNSWVISNPIPELTFNRYADGMWEDVLKGMGTEYAELAFYPLDPNLN
ncbi:MAG: YqgE/AlgH family protein [Bacteroidota bacterium]